MVTRISVNGTSFNVDETLPRRTWLARMSSAVMAFGLMLGYGMFGTVIGWFLYPAKASSRTWQFLADLGSFGVGHSVTYEAPAGQKIVVTRLTDNGVPEDFIALSSVCRIWVVRCIGSRTTHASFAPVTTELSTSRGNRSQGRRRIPISRCRAIR